MSDFDALRRKAAGLLVIRLGSNMRPPRRAEDDAKAVARIVERFPIAGLILFNGHWPETRQTLASLQTIASRPLLVMTDMERGLGQQVQGATVFPHLRAFGEIGDEERVEAFARASAREALACGVHVALAPVADVNRNPQNPIISTRAFGETASAVASLVAAYVRGARAEGLLATVKHFPGHGNTAEDSHATLPTVQDSREEMDREDWPPFRAAFAEGAELVMTAHVSYPDLDPTGCPATLSRPIMTDLLRGEMGFDGVVISDSLHMEGIKEEGRTEGDLAVEQIRAGVDLLLDPEDPESIIEAVANAVQDGELGEERLDEALARAQGLRQKLDLRFGARLWADPASVVPPGEVGSKAHEQLARDVARRAIATRGSLPRDGRDGLLAVMLRSYASPFDPDEQPLAAALRRAYPGIDYREVTPETSDEALDVLREAAGRASTVVVALVVKPAAWHEYGLPERLEKLARDLVNRPASILVSLGDPRALDPFSEDVAQLVTFSDTPVAQEALAELLQRQAG